ncbi:MAG TPA: mobile mystery protein B [Clostridia bacterium]|nr:mobile mystery protein B [Clostridia bacterium]
MSNSLLSDSPGNTPISEDEIEALIPNLATRAELNEWERENIILAERWCFSPRVLKNFHPICEADMRELHRQMFGKTWKWAGSYRKTEKTIGVPVVQINNAIAAFLGDADYWIKEKRFEPDEIAVRFHHRLVHIHPFPNGNGRHSRLIADMLAVQLGRPRFSWGRTNLQPAGALRDRYISAIKRADEGQIKPLMEFARS